MQLKSLVIIFFVVSNILCSSRTSTELELFYILFFIEKKTDQIAFISFLFCFVLFYFSMLWTPFSAFTRVFTTCLFKYLSGIMTPPRRIIFQQVHTYTHVHEVSGEIDDSWRRYACTGNQNLKKCECHSWWCDIIVKKKGFSLKE